MTARKKASVSDIKKTPAKPKEDSVSVDLIVSLKFGLSMMIRPKGVPKAIEEFPWAEKLWASLSPEDIEKLGIEGILSGSRKIEVVRED